jgi:hypothetical protein
MKRDIIALAIFLAVFSGFVILSQSLVKPTIYIIREYQAESLQGSCTIIDYMIGGYTTSAIFYNYEGDAYRQWMIQLEKEGRIVKK